MAAPSKSADGKWLIGSVKFPSAPGPSMPSIPGMKDDTIVAAISIDQIAALADLVSLDAEGQRVRDGVSVQLTTGTWVILQGTRAQVATLLGIT